MKVLCFGDSNTWGYDPRGFWGGQYDMPWPEWLGMLTGWEVVNLGENGRQIPGGPVELLSGDRVLVMLGTNDLLQGATAEWAGERMEAFLTGLLPHCPGVVLGCPPPMKRGAWVPTDALVEGSCHLGDVYAALARKRGIPFVDTREWGIELAFDGVHFTEEGHRVFAEKLRMELQGF